MQYAIGFLIALFIALTGVGAGTITVPVLVLFLNVPAATAVAIGLMFSAAVKAILVPAQIARGNVAWRTLGFMLLGGVPGVLVGSLLLRHLVTVGSENVLNAILGAVLVGTASWQIFYSFRQAKAKRGSRDRSPWLSWLMFPVGAEVGFSSAGAGALGSAALLSFTELAPVQVVGTDILFGFTLSLLGSAAHGWAGTGNLAHAANMELLLQLIVGGFFGAMVGTLMSSRVPRRPLRFALWVWLFVLGGDFLLNSYQVWAATH
ncbi:MAG TPA: sulfite exporter TauE/SafE family protein [Terracidiphilus sp.]|nr:sulfite exporter TauE/SafE family protein [Terracidiphilus sp.]